MDDIGVFQGEVMVLQHLRVADGEMEAETFAKHVGPRCKKSGALTQLEYWLQPEMPQFCAANDSLF